MTKEEKIKEAWGVHYASDIDENGYRISNVGELSWDKSCFYIEENELGYFIIRPKSLQGIENNNGWIKIESESDLPKNTTLCHVIKSNGKQDVVKLYNNEGFIEEITHYQPIEKPQPPIY